MWSILTMPAILRIFLYQTDASLSLLGLCGSYGQVGVRTTRSPPCHMVGGARVCEHYAMPAVCVVIGPPGLLPSGLLRCLPCCLYSPTRSVCRVGLSRTVRVGNECRPAGSCFPIWVYHRLPRPGTRPKSKGSHMCRPLPNITGSCAR